jgi:hypothetical protein
MELSIHISSVVDKRLNVLKKLGGNASQAAEHARKIINQSLQGICSPKQIGRLTRYGEARIPNCIKFDLVGGYRLIAVIRRREIGFLFVGSHDECDNWAKNNARLESPWALRAPTVVRVAGENGERHSRQVREREGEKEVDDYDAELLRDLTDGDLRKIFCGICGE